MNQTQLMILVMRSTTSEEGPVSLKYIDLRARPNLVVALAEKRVGRHDQHYVYAWVKTSLHFIVIRKNHSGFQKIALVQKKRSQKRLSLAHPQRNDVIGRRHGTDIGICGVTLPYMISKQFALVTFSP